jgi:hypothetical protein
VDRGTERGPEQQSANESRALPPPRAVALEGEVSGPASHTTHSSPRGVLSHQMDVRAWQYRHPGLALCRDANCTRYDMNGASVLVSSPCPADKDVCWKTLGRVQSRTVGMSETRERAPLGDVTVQECPLQTPLIRRPLCVEYQATMESCSDKFHVDIPNVA